MNSSSDPSRSFRVAAALLAVLACLSAPASGWARPAPARDPVFAIMGSPDAWSVSRDGAGCYVMSPWRRQTSRMVLGIHPKFGAGLYAVGLPTSVPDDDRTTRVLVRTEAGDVARVAVMVAPDLLFVRLSPEEFSQGLVEVGRAGVLWLSVRGTWVSHSGKAPAEAVETYRKDCAGWVPPAAPTPLAGGHSGAHGG